MATNQTMRTIVLLANADLSTKQFYIVKAHTVAGEVVLSDTPATDIPIGVLQNKPAAGERAIIALLDGAVLKMVADGVIAAGAEIGLAGTDGQVTSVPAVTEVSLGNALETSAAAAEIISVASHLFRAKA